MKPASEAELAEIVRGANGPFVVRGGGTRGIGRAGVGEVLETGGMAGISLYEPGALTLVAGAGTPMVEVETALAAEGQRLAFEVPDMRGLLGTGGGSTIGGVVAANASGPRRVQVGACRDHLLGVRFVDGTGAVVKNGGRVMKNVTGYDLVKLMAGARGTLGVLTEVSLKVLPAPEAEVTLVARGHDLAAGAAAMAVALGSPFEVSGAAHLALGEGETRLRMEGLAASVAYRREALRARLGGDWDVAEGEPSAALWREVRDVAPFAARAGAVWRVMLKPSDAPGVVAALAGVAEAAIADWGGGLLWLFCPGGGAQAVRAAAALAGGHATLWRQGPGAEGEAIFSPEVPALVSLAKGLRATFDPRGLFNPGLMEG